MIATRNTFPRRLASLAIALSFPTVGCEQQSDSKVWDEGQVWSGATVDISITPAAIPPELLPAEVIFDPGVKFETAKPQRVFAICSASEAGRSATTGAGGEYCVADAEFAVYIAPLADVDDSPDCETLGDSPPEGAGAGNLMLASGWNGLAPRVVIPVYVGRVIDENGWCNPNDSERHFATLPQ